MQLQRQGRTNDCWLATIAMLSDTPLDKVRRSIDYAAWTKSVERNDYDDREYRQRVSKEVIANFLPGAGIIRFAIGRCTDIGRTATGKELNLTGKGMLRLRNKAL